MNRPGRKITTNVFLGLYFNVGEVITKNFDICS